MIDHLTVSENAAEQTSHALGSASMQEPAEGNAINDLLPGITDITRGLLEISQARAQRGRNPFGFLSRQYRQEGRDLAAMQGLLQLEAAVRLTDLFSRNLEAPNTATESNDQGDTVRGETDTSENTLRYDVSGIAYCLQTLDNELAEKVRVSLQAQQDSDPEIEALKECYTQETFHDLVDDEENGLFIVVPRASGSDANEAQVFGVYLADHILKQVVSNTLEAPTIISTGTITFSLPPLERPVDLSRVSQIDGSTEYQINDPVSNTDIRLLDCRFITGTELKLLLPPVNNTSDS